MEKCLNHYRILQGLLFLIVSMLPAKSYQFTSSSNQVYLNQTGVINIPHIWQLKSNTGLSFRTCSNGRLLHQVGANGDSLTLSLNEGALQVQWTLNSTRPPIKAGQNFTNKVWYYVSLEFSLGTLELKVLKGSQVVLGKVIANSTYNSDLWNIKLDGGTPLQVGMDFTGCIMPGTNVDFTNSNFTEGVIFGNCSLLEQQNCTDADKDFDDCYSFPCKNQGTCVDQYKNYTCKCLPIYSGRNCEKDLSSEGCKIHPCQKNATCIADGSGFKCLCQPGFTGQYCMIDINECISQPCEHGTCIDRINGVECNCTGSGYQGPTCSENVNECATSNPCGNGTCSDTSGSFRCRCPQGFSGNLCNEEINECMSNPCQNGGNCQDLIDNFKCHCATGFKGALCEINISDCLASSCPWNHSICVDQVNNFICKCKDGYTGPPESCEDINECASNPCANNATCLNLVNNYECRCAPGFDGARCTNNINDCKINPCQNNGTCVDKINGYKCNCLPGFTGVTCQVNINDCKNDSCKYGMCTDMVQGFRCTCIAGWTGDRCDRDFDECTLKPCHNGAKCINKFNDYECSCTPGYEGKNCSIDINDCINFPCKGNGYCIDLVNGYRCNCTDDWMGVNCSHAYRACSFHPCQNNGNCTSVGTNHTYSCDCVTGFRGGNCEENIDDCIGVSCKDGKICYDHIDGFECACPKGKKGNMCLEDINECLLSPCKNKGVCKDIDGGYECKCPSKIVKIDTNPPIHFLTGYNGTNCENDINECNIRINDTGICLNGGSCKNLKGDFTCHCDNTGKDGGNYYSGRNCEVVLDYCKIKTQCQNNATCVPTSTLDKYTCHCVTGFTGRLCETNIDDCINQPCQYNGTCVDGINSYSCLCPNGTKGKNCEMNIDECLSNPCLNNGTCKDLLNGRSLDDPLRYQCNCSDTGFKGDRCQNNIDDCLSNPCKNDATCIDGIKEYTCKCYEGYRGKQCEEDIDECASQPCVHAIKCLQRSNQALYKSNSPYPGFSKFSYGKAAGYYCSCEVGYEGTNCDENIDDCKKHACLNKATCIDAIGYYNCSCNPGYKGFFCENDINECKLPKTPCEHSSTCVNTFGSYNCNCVEKARPWFGGKNCSVELTGCRKQPCQNNGKCRPKLVEGNIHDYDCDCSSGFTGKKCTVPTSMSFNGQSTLEVTIHPMNQTQTSFKFRTTWSEGFLTSFPLRDNVCVTTEIQDSHLVLAINGSSLRVSTVVVNDATWQSVDILFDEELNVHVTLTGTGCNLMKCLKSRKISRATTGEVSFGKVHGGMHLSTKVPYIGCLEDIKIDGKYLLSDNPMVDKLENVSVGCQRKYQCFPDTCNKRGTCIDLWIRFQCVCDRPFYGKTCEQEVTAVTFSLEDSQSFVEYSLFSLQESLETKFDFSFFFTTRRRNSLIAYFVDSDSATKNNNVLPSDFRLLLQDGKVAALLNTCDLLTYNTSREYSNGERHFLRVLITERKFNLQVDELKVELPLKKICKFNATKLYVGQFPADIPKKSRRKRSANSISAFKGVLQDMNLNNFSLVVFNNNTDNKVGENDKILTPLNYSNIVSGQKTDDICSSKTPCKNNGTCGNKYYNDFKCNCTSGFTGKDCSNIDYCLSITCKDGAVCQNAVDGYECLRAATFNVTSYIEFQAKTHLPEPKNLSLEFRTREKEGVLIKADNLNIGLHFVLQLQDGIVMVGSDQNIVFNSSIPVNDGHWHSFFIGKTSSSNFTIKITNLKKKITVENSSINILLSGIADNRTVISIGSGFDGCMRGVRIDTNLLPFDLNDVNTSRSLAYGKVRQQDVEISCKGDDVCATWHHKCANGATCIDKWNKYVCNCSVGYEGDLCRDNIDDCKNNSCEHGATCVDGINEYSCSCAPGYNGSRCENDINECKIYPNCENNGTCTDLVNGYNCTCTERFTGDNCEFKINQTCATLACKNGTCTEQTYTDYLANNYKVVNCLCDAGFEGRECEMEIDFCGNVTCQNNGTCSTNKTRTGFQCKCDNDHDGIYCENRIDHCATSPCLHGATCTDLVGDFSCKCVKGWTGKNCGEDIDECKNRTEWCLNNGVCTNLNGSFDCNCTGTGYGGYLCADDINECKAPEGSPCKHNASCDNLQGSYFCDCKGDSGYEGKNCEIPNCRNIKCAYNSTCFETEKEWFCLCPKYYEGPLCQFKGLCTDNPCKNGAVCTQNYTAQTYKCECATGFKGQNCSENINECKVKNPCQNGGDCTDSFGSYNCKCNILKFLGKNCHIANPCSPEANVCVNGGNCTYTLHGDSAHSNCTCRTGWQGITCAEKLIASASSTNIYLYIGIPLAFLLLAVIIGVVFFVMNARKKRATSGTYSPSRQEMSGSRVELGNVIKIPPTERLI